MQIANHTTIHAKKSFSSHDKIENKYMVSNMAIVKKKKELISKKILQAKIAYFFCSEKIEYDGIQFQMFYFFILVICHMENKIY